MQVGSTSLCYNDYAEIGVSDRGENRRKRQLGLQSSQVCARKKKQHTKPSTYTAHTLGQETEWINPSPHSYFQSAAAFRTTSWIYLQVSVYLACSFVDVIFLLADNFTSTYCNNAQKKNVDAYIFLHTIKITTSSHKGHTCSEVKN